jgi:hypothetical protein
MYGLMARIGQQPLVSGIDLVFDVYLRLKIGISISQVIDVIVVEFVFVEQWI